MIDKPLESFSGFVSGNSVTMFVDDQVVPGFVILKFISPLDNLAEIAQWPITKAETRLVRFKLSTKEKKRVTILNVYSMVLLLHWPVCLLAIFVDATNI